MNEDKIVWGSLRKPHYVGPKTKSLFSLTKSSNILF